jgi:hypothetical protein
MIAACRYYVDEAVAHDNWNGGMDGHDVVLFLPLDQLAKVDPEDQAEVASGVKDLLSKLANGIETEYFNNVRFELNDENDFQYLAAKPFSPTPPINPDALDFWKPGLARVFISHRDQHKRDARELSEALEEYGFTCFVAHDTIQPMSEWRAEIMKGLQTMEVMLIYLTDDFDESMWCHQEVGFALGKGVPIISLKLGKKDPPGFISHVQAMRGQQDDPFSAASGLFPLIGKALGKQERLQEVLVSSFVASPSFSDTKSRFDRMNANVTKLTDKQLQQIIDGFYTNDQLYNAGILTSKFQRLRKFLEKVTGREFTIEGRTISEVKRKVPRGFLDDLGDDVPF